MKKVYFVRHAKSEWGYSELSDFERPLNKRGKHDAPFMAELLGKKGVSPDLIVSSPALRAYYTARTFARGLNYPPEKLQCSETLYEASAGAYLQLVNELDNNLNVVMLFGHNPDLTTIVNLLGDKQIENVPTAGVVEIEFPFDNWQEIEINTGKTVSFEFPKKYLR